MSEGAIDGRIDLGAGAWLEHRAGFVRDHLALMAALERDLPLAQETIRIMGREVNTPRLTSWHGDPGRSYSYSGRTFEPHPWTRELSTLRDAVRDATGVPFNSVLVNLYRDGADSMGAHADDEPELGLARDDIRIASVSLGAKRRFVLLPRRNGHKWEALLGEGDLLLMGGTTQRHYRHAAPKTRKPVEKRMNLTFRVILEGLR
jgi:alkylated DNA repair dioxygenase AlkB